MWAINNSLKGWTLYELSIREMQLIVQTLSANEKKLTQVCKKNDLQWETLSEQKHAPLFEALNLSQQNYPDLTLTANSHEDTDYFVVRPKKIIHPRLHVRYELELTCHISANQKDFTTTTFDLSEGGLYFKDTLPDWVAGYFFVIIQTPDTAFKLMCSMVEDQKERKRVQIVAEESDQHFVAYKNWLTQQKSVS